MQLSFKTDIPKPDIHLDSKDMIFQERRENAKN